MMEKILLKLFNWLVPRTPVRYTSHGIRLGDLPKWKPVWIASVWLRDLGWYESYNQGKPSSGCGCRRDIYAMWRWSSGDMHARITKSNAWDPSLLEYYPNWSRNDFLRLIKKMDGSEWL